LLCGLPCSICQYRPLHECARGCEQWTGSARRRQHPRLPLATAALQLVIPVLPLLHDQALGVPRLVLARVRVQVQVAAAAVARLTCRKTTHILLLNDASDLSTCASWCCRPWPASCEAVKIPQLQQQCWTPCSEDANKTSLMTTSRSLDFEGCSTLLAARQPMPQGMMLMACHRGSWH
jgi:hypothetical protein